jgi:hypothetical protein
MPGHARRSIGHVGRPLVSPYRCTVIPHDRSAICAVAPSRRTIAQARGCVARAFGCNARASGRSLGDLGRSLPVLGRPLRLPDDRIPVPDVRARGAWERVPWWDDRYPAGTAASQSRSRAGGCRARRPRAHNSRSLSGGSRNSAYSSALAGCGAVGDSPEPGRCHVPGRRGAGGGDHVAWDSGGWCLTSRLQLMHRSFGGRTTSLYRTVNLCFEDLGAATVFVDLNSSGHG